MRYFSWDNFKARANVRKHGVDFETAARAFLDPFAVRKFDRNVSGETRWHTTGMVDGHLLLLVVHTSQEDNGDEYIRIISARPATRDEEKTYFSDNRELGYF